MNIIDLINLAIFPEFCINCGNLNGIICPTCLESIEKIDFPICLVCGNLCIDGKIHKACNQGICLKSFNTFYNYNLLIKKLILKSKSGPMSYNHLEFLVLNSENINLLKNLINNIDYIVPIPMSSKNRKLRLVDQSLYISSIVKQLTNKQVLYAIDTITNNVENKSLNRKDRFNNAKYKFRLNKNISPKIQNKNLILIDDIATTGATFFAVSELLLKNGANEIHAYSLAYET